MRRVVIVFALLAPLLASCSDEGDGGGGGNGWEPCTVTSTEIGHATGSTDVILRSGYGGGLPPPIFMPDELPDVLLYGDGRILVSDQASTFAAPRMLDGHLDEAQIQEMLHAVEGTCSLQRDWRLDAPVYDVGGFWVETNTDAGAHQTWVVGLGFDEIASSIPEKQKEQRAALMELDRTLRASADEAGLAPYEPEELGVFFEPLGDTPAEGTPTAPWPLDTDLATFGQPHPEYQTARCGVVEGADISSVLAALEPDASGMGPLIEDGGTHFQLVTRPMLPGETDCLALIA